MTSNDGTDGKRQQLAMRLRQAREYVGLSQDDVAVALGVSRPAITNIEAGSRRVEAVELETLSRLYGRPVEYLLSGEESGDAEEGRIAFLARATQGLSARDLEELGRFAAFLKSSAKTKKRGQE
ncbi:MAG TPA: helix-turn-helix transcriptional regulator [Burkholderiaceae bacterium]|nr:helix-turn-helix transcriptional regulator [Burkholderiaceae bacterium]